MRQPDDQAGGGVVGQARGRGIRGGTLEPAHLVAPSGGSSPVRAVAQAPPRSAEVVTAEGGITGQQGDDLGRAASADQRRTVEQGAGQPRVHADGG